MGRKKMPMSQEARARVARRKRQQARAGKVLVIAMAGLAALLVTLQFTG